MKDNKADVEASIAIAKISHPGNDKVIEVTKIVHQDCGSVTDADRCEFAGKLIQCTHNSMIKQGIDPKSLS